MNHFGITPDQPESILQFGPADMICSICNTFKSELSAPLLLLSGLLAVTAVSTLLSGTGDCIPQMKTDLSRVSALIIAGSTAAPLLHCLQRTAETLHEGEILMTGFVPVFSGFLAAGGTVTGASTYQLLILFLTELIMQLTNGIFLPLIHSAAALGITDAINPSSHRLCEKNPECCKLDACGSYDTICCNSFNSQFYCICSRFRWCQNRKVPEYKLDSYHRTRCVRNLCIYIGQYSSGRKRSRFNRYFSNTFHDFAAGNLYHNLSYCFSDLQYDFRIRGINITEKTV